MRPAALGFFITSEAIVPTTLPGPPPLSVSGLTFVVFAKRNSVKLAISRTYAIPLVELVRVDASRGNQFETCNLKVPKSPSYTSIDETMALSD